MTEQEYLTQRVDDQIDWYDRKSIWNQKMYKILQVIVILTSISIPFLSGLPDYEGFIKYIIGGAGVIIAAITGLLSLYKFQENWISYRTTCETLRHEKYLFLTKTPPYNNSEAFNLFVQSIESIISRENSDWREAMKRIEEQSKKE